MSGTGSYAFFSKLDKESFSWLQKALEIEAKKIEANKNILPSENDDILLFKFKFRPKIINYFDGKNILRNLLSTILF